MTGHGYFREYLCKYGFDNEVNCSFYDNGNENAEYIFLYCHRFRLEHDLLDTVINERVAPDNIFSHMLRSVEVCYFVKMLSAKLIQELRRIERIHRTGIL